MERVKNGEEGGRKNRPKVRMDGGCYRMNSSLRSLIICDIVVDVYSNTNLNDNEISRTHEIERIKMAKKAAVRIDGGCYTQPPLNGVETQNMSRR